MDKKKDAIDKAKDLVDITKNNFAGPCDEYAEINYKPEELGKRTWKAFESLGRLAATLKDADDEYAQNWGKRLSLVKEVFDIKSGYNLGFNVLANSYIELVEETVLYQKGMEGAHVGIKEYEQARRTLYNDMIFSNFLANSMEVSTNKERGMIMEKAYALYPVSSSTYEGVIGRLAEQMKKTRETEPESSEKLFRDMEALRDLFATVNENAEKLANRGLKDTNLMVKALWELDIRIKSVTGRLVDRPGAAGRFDRLTFINQWVFDVERFNSMYVGAKKDLEPDMSIGYPATPYADLENTVYVNFHMLSTIFDSKARDAKQSDADRIFMELKTEVEGRYAMLKNYLDELAKLRGRQLEVYEKRVGELRGKANEAKANIKS